MKSILIAIVLLASTVYADIEFTRNADLNRWIERDKPECIEGVSQGDEKCIEWLFSNVWGLATESTPVDSRPYLFSLAIDLYNSMGPDTSHCGVMADGPPDCGKIGAWYQINRQTVGRKEAGRQEQDWIWAERAQNKDIAVQLEFLKYYVVDNVSLDEATATASITTSVDLLEPSHYISIQRWMAQNATAMENNVPPWKAVTWTTEHRHEWATVVTSPIAATTQAVTGEASPPNPPLHLRGDGGLKPKKAAKKEVPPTQPTTPTKEPPTAPAVPWWVWVAGGVVVVLLGGLTAYAVGRRKKG